MTALLFGLCPKAAGVTFGAASAALALGGAVSQRARGPAGGPW